MIYLVDTSIWLDFFNKKKKFSHAQQLQELLHEGKAAWCPMVRLELQRSGRNRESTITLFSEILPDLKITQIVWNLAYTIALDCAKKGRPVPNTDILIYATALHHNCQVLHNDKHFDWLAEIIPYNSDIKT